MFSIIILCIFGFFAGLIAKALHPGDDPVGFLPTVGIGVAGSFIGGFINWILGRGHQGPLASSGMIMSVIGAVIFLAIWRWWSLKNSDSGPRKFFSGELE